MMHITSTSNWDTQSWTPLSSTCQKTDLLHFLNIRALSLTNMTNSSDVTLTPVLAMTTTYWSTASVFLLVVSSPFSGFLVSVHISSTSPTTFVELIFTMRTWFRSMWPARLGVIWVSVASAFCPHPPFLHSPEVQCFLLLYCVCFKFSVLYHHPTLHTPSRAGWQLVGGRRRRHPEFNF